MVRQKEELVELAVEHRFLSNESKERLLSESLKSSMPPEAFALKMGLLQPWQIETLRMLSQPDDVVPGYRLKGLLGRGGFGSVFRATQTNMSRDVALKTIPLNAVKDSSAARRFEREAKIVGQLRHPHIVAAFDFGFHNDRLYLSLELVDGKDLGYVLKRVKKFNEYATWHLIRQTVTGLAYAAKLGITHRDIKPANLLVSNPPLGFSLPRCVPFVKIADFGLACFAETRRDDGITLENSGIGTPSYVAPEQLRGGDVDVRADIYSLGATAFRLLSGTPPYRAKAPMEVAKEKLGGDEAWLKELGSFSKPTQALIQKMSAFDVERRFASHEELLTAIDKTISMVGDESEDNTQTFELTQDERAVTAELITAESILSDEMSDPATQEFASDFDDSTGFDIADHPPEPRNRVRNIVLGGLLTIALLASALFYWIPSGDPRLPTSSKVNYRADIRTTVRSFDGLNLDFSKFKTKRGTWSVDTDEEGGKVLFGSNCQVVFAAVDQNKQPFDFFRYSIGVNLREDLDIEIEPIVSGADGPELKVVVTAEGCQVFWNLDKRVPSSSAVHMWAEPGENSGYNRIGLERHPKFWRVTRDSETVAVIGSPSAGDAEVSLTVKGEANFESPEVCKMVKIQ